MSELDKIVKEWESVLSRDPLDTPSDLIEDTIDLLKEYQKKETPVESELEGSGRNWWVVCPECHGNIGTLDNYCKHCGKHIHRNCD